MWAQTDVPELDAAMRELGRARFVVHRFGKQSLPDALAAVHDWGGIADVLIAHSPKVAAAYRTPSSEGLDPFEPSRVLWSYASDLLWTTRALLALPPPADPGAPSGLLEAPQGLGLPAGWRAERAVTVAMLPLR